jgi:hypothetical protein
MKADSEFAADLRRANLVGRALALPYWSQAAAMLLRSGVPCWSSRMSADATTPNVTLGFRLLTG